MDDYKLLELRIKRNLIASNGNDPDEWVALAKEYEEIGALSNAAACQRRADAYRMIREGLKNLDAELARVL